MPVTSRAKRAALLKPHLFDRSLRSRIRDVTSRAKRAALLKQHLGELAHLRANRVTSRAKRVALLKHQKIDLIVLSPMPSPAARNARPY